MQKPPPNSTFSRRHFLGVAGGAALATLIPASAVKVLAQQTNKASNLSESGESQMTLA